MLPSEVLAHSRQFAVLEAGSEDIIGEGYYAAAGIVVVIWHKDVLHKGVVRYETLDELCHFIVTHRAYGTRIEWLRPVPSEPQRLVEVTPQLVAQRYKASRRDLQKRGAAVMKEWMDEADEKEKEVSCHKE